MLETIRDIYYGLVEEANFDTYRYLYDHFSVSERLTGLVGPRGVGKTTMLLQFIRHRVKDLKQALYMTADHIYFNKLTLFDFVREVHETEGVSLFFIDEVHKYSGWNQELKNIYDALPRVKVVFSGSSSLSLVKGSHDLSRRASIHYLPGLSFREYLVFRTGKPHDKLSFHRVMTKHEDVAAELSHIPRLKGHFRSYLRDGYYPFVFERSARFQKKIGAVIEKTIFEDIANFYRLRTENLHCFKKILYFLATIPPGKVNVHNLAHNLGVDDRTALHYLTILKDTGLVRLLPADATGSALIRRPEKIYLDNPVLYSAICHALDEIPNTGTVRELFFFCALENAGIHVHPARRGGDFRAKRFTFEIGGRNKGTSQVRGSGKSGFVVKDDILVGGRNTLPLYIFGFLY